MTILHSLFVRNCCQICRKLQASSTPHEIEKSAKSQTAISSTDTSSNAKMEAQTASRILMIRPVNFGFNPETALDNTFQKRPDDDSSSFIQSKALQEFDNFVAKLTSVGICVLVIDDTPDPPTPDSIFPNNWISFHTDGTVCLFPLLAKNRRLERKASVLSLIQQRFKIERTLDLTDSESSGQFLEGTGSMILDRQNRIIYASRSARTHASLVEKFASVMNYSKIVMLESHNDGKLIYHTNVMMCLGDKFAVVCLDAITDPLERKEVTESIESSGKEIIEISVVQMNNFAGNMLQVQNSTGEKYLVMSTRAYKALMPTQIQKLKTFNELIHTDLSTIEDNGGGSVRCTMAEIFLQPEELYKINEP